MSWGIPARRYESFPAGRGRLELTLKSHLMVTVNEGTAVSAETTQDTDAEEKSTFRPYEIDSVQRSMDEVDELAISAD